MNQSLSFVKFTPLVRSTLEVGECSEHYNCSEANIFPQALQRFLTSTSEHDYITLFNFPFYHMHMTMWQDSMPFSISREHHHCIPYGYEGREIVIYIQTTETEQRSALTIGLN